MTEETRLRNENKFIEKSIEVHEDKYDYSKVDYKRNSTKVEIVCKEHGSFWQLPGAHKSGQGCPKCAGIGLSNEEIVNQFKEVHGDRYNYSKVEHKGNSTKVEIICKEHGSFWQWPNDHKGGSGCQKCAGVYKKTTEEIIYQFKRVHGDKYEYSKVDYKNNSTKVEIFCKEHGSFWQWPNDHMNGSGCPKCALESRIIYPQEKIVDQFKEVQGNKYDYSKVNYKGNSTKVEIICKEHGSFWQWSGDHKNGSGCPKCALENRELMPLEKVIDQFKEAHGDKYNYSKVDYKGCSTKVEIICKEHGPFLQTPDIHKRGSGCTRCQESKGERKIREYLESKDINFIQEYALTISHEGVNYNHRFDFFLPDLDIYIEYDGIQHFEPIEFFGGEEAFENTKFRDNIKDIFCVNNNLKMIRISYMNIDSVHEILNSEILKGN